MSRPLPPGHRVKRTSKRSVARVKPKQRIDGTFKKSRRNKYNAQGRHVDDFWFASGMEADRYVQLKTMEKMGLVHDLKLQTPFEIRIKGVLIARYLSDFDYWIKPKGRFRTRIIEDVKGKVTRDYALKKKLVETLHEITIHEVPGRQVKSMMYIAGDGTHLL